MTLRSQKSVVFVGTLSFFLTLTFTFFLSLSSASASTISRPMFHDGLVGYWDFDVGKGGGTVYDRSGYGNHGTMTNMDPATDWVDGKIGGALSFNQTDNDDYVLVSGPSLGNTYTISLWMNAQDSGANYNDLIAESTENIFSFHHIVGKLNLYFSGSDHFSDSNVTFNEWHHVLVVNDVGNATFYLDGQKDGVVTSAPGIDVTYFGNVGSGFDTEDFEGKLDDVRIYNRALSASEVSHLYKIGRPTIKRALLDDGLVGYWNFDVGKGGSTVYDMSGKGNDGTISTTTDTTIAWVNGIEGGAMDFDGSDDSLQTGITNLSATDFTFSAWISVDDLSGDQRTILSKWGSGTQGIVFRIETDGSLRAWTHNSNVSKRTAAGVITTGTWYHVNFVHIDAGGNGHFYVNGVLFPNELDDDVLNDVAALSNPVIVGQRQETSYFDPFDGIIDEVRVYNRALSAGEVSRLYTMTRPKINVTRTTGSLSDGLVGHWSFDGKDVYNTFIKDVSGNNNHGTDSGGSAPAIGKIGQGRRFDGVDDVVTVSSFTDIGGYPLTLAGWSKRSGVQGSTFDGIVTVGDSFDEYYGIGWSGDMPTLVGRNTSFERLQAGSYLDDEWVHMVGVFKNSTEREFYINGEYDSEHTDPVPELTTADSVHMGDRHTSAGYFTGISDDIRIYNRALSADEVRRLYNLGR